MFFKKNSQATLFRLNGSKAKLLIVSQNVFFHSRVPLRTSNIENV